MRLEEVEYIVIGAGAAGLAAAHELDSAGAEVCVLEASSRPGGRVLTLHDPRSSVPLELGADFVHGDAPETLRLLEAAGQAFYDIAGSQWVAGEDGWHTGAKLWKSLQRVMNRLDARRRPDRSFRDFLDNEPGLGQRDRQAALAFVEGFHAADASQVSERSLARMPGGGAEEALDSARVVGGYDRLTGYLADRLGRRLRLGHTVERVTWTRGRVDVVARYAEGPLRIRAGAAVVALPLGVLQAPAEAECAVTLDPVPATLRRALSLLAMGSVTRVTLLFDSRFWEQGVPAAREVDARSIGFLHAPDRPFNVWWSLYPVRAPVWVGWAGGPTARRLRSHGESVEDQAVGELARCLGLSPRRVRERLVAAFSHDWDGDPRARGAYSYALVGGAGAFRELSRPIEGTLFIAGEHTVDGWLNGTVEGALVSGRRAARQALTRRVGGAPRVNREGRVRPPGGDSRSARRRSGRGSNTPYGGG